MDEMKGSGLAFSDFYMSRPLRIQYKNAVYHVTSRGNEKKDIYSSDEDRMLFLRILSWVVARCHWVCHSYCLMNNHYHLLIETPEANLSEGMRHLNGIYTQKMNEAHQRVGHIFQGRYKAFLIESELYLYTVARYIVLNPVRAKIVDSAEKYRWSSFNQTIGLVRVRNFLTVDKILLAFDGKRDIARRKYREFVHSGIFGPSPFVDAKHQILGSEQFTLNIFLKELLRENLEIPTEQRLIGRPNLCDLPLRSSDKTIRNAAIQNAVLECGYSAAEVARYIPVHYSRVSRIIKSLKARPDPIQAEEWMA